jgi:hypothetical protein
MDNTGRSEPRALQAAAVTRRLDALFRTMLSDYLLREQFITDPVQIVAEYVYGKKVSPHVAAAANRLIYAFASNPQLVWWFRDYAIEHRQRPPTANEFYYDLARAVVQHHGERVVLALMRSAAQDEGLTGFEDAVLHYLQAAFIVGAIGRVADEPTATATDGGTIDGTGTDGTGTNGTFTGTGTNGTFTGTGTDGTLTATGTGTGTGTGTDGTLTGTGTGTGTDGTLTGTATGTGTDGTLTGTATGTGTDGTLTGTATGTLTGTDGTFGTFTLTGTSGTLTGTGTLTGFTLPGTSTGTFTAITLTTFITMTGTGTGTGTTPFTLTGGGTRGPFTGTETIGRPGFGPNYVLTILEALSEYASFLARSGALDTVAEGE